MSDYREAIDAVLQEVGRAVVGKEEITEKIMMAILAGGHILVEDIPGMGKTTMALAFSKAMGLEEKRVQFTPDVLPADLTGFTLYQKATEQFVYQPGAVMCNLLLADEINRASSRAQSALLEAMEERQITVDGRTYPLEKPFVVIATQNNVGTAGTQFLPYAQVDRFMVRLSVGYPDHDAQMALLKDRLSENPLDAVSQVLTREELLAMQAEARAVQTSDALLDYIPADDGFPRSRRDRGRRQPARRAASLPNGESARVSARPRFCRQRRRAGGV